MIVYIVSRTENGRTAIWAPFTNPYAAGAMVNAHIAFREKEGYKVHRRIVSIPQPFKEGWKIRVGGSDGHPVMTDAPDCINCVVLEVEIVSPNGNKAIYNITQAAIQG